VEVGGDQPHTNRLVHAVSPYLLQHAQNPVDWYPWGEEALEAARTQERPIFLSVGYSTCYWCHVMEREAFEKQDIARLLNEHFVCIKVDREERPDVDELYMTAVQLFSNGHGGWPMSVFLEPVTLRPFFAGTYFPPADAHGRPGFGTLLQRIATAWTDEREALLTQADRAGKAISGELRVAAAPVDLGGDLVEKARAQLLSSYDSALGGFGTAPKFPQPGQLHLLLATAWEDETARSALLHTVDAMARGGMYDQVSGGFHRYSTDARWLVPHFEKMLYDNGQLAEVHALVVEKTGDPWFVRILRQTLNYVLREMTSAEGRFYSAQDAEVDASEGASYVWRREDFEVALRDAGLAEELDFATQLYGLQGGPNFRDPHDPGATPVNVLFLSRRPAAEDFDRIDRINEALLAARNERKQPITDDKTLAGWNGLMIAGLAEGGRVLDDSLYVEAAATAARFCLENLRDQKGGLLRSWRNGRAAIPAFLEDHAYLAHGLFRLHAATGDSSWLDEALRLLDDARRHFADPEGGGFYDARANQEDLFVRVRSRYDGATPSANSQMLLNLLAAHEATGDELHLREATETLSSMSRRIAEHPTSAMVALRGLDQIAREHPSYLPQSAGSPAPSSSPVTVSVEPDLLDLRTGPADFEVRIQIAEGFHLNAHEPGDAGLSNLELVAVGGGIGIEVDYPPGAPLQTTFSDGEIQVHEGELRLRGVARVAATGSPGGQLVLKWQACDESVCLAPEEEVLPVVLRTR
jgi:uncharacterized protein YyaL (SSP411 family)